MTCPALQFLILTVAGWLNRKQVAVVEYLIEENRVLRDQLDGQRLRLTDAQRRRLAVKGKAIGRKVLGEVASIVTPDTILQWRRELVAKKYDGSKRRGPGRPRTAEFLEGFLGFGRSRFQLRVARSSWWNASKVDALSAMATFKIRG